MNDAPSLLACEPIPIIIHIAGGPGVTLAWRAQGLGILFVVVALKVGLFAWMVRRTIPWARAAGAMLAANVVSSIVGFFVAALMGTPIIFFPVGALIIGIVASSFARSLSEPLSATPLRPFVRTFGALVFLLSIGSMAGGGALFAIDPDMEIALYWTIKIAAAFFVVSFSLAITILFESAIAVALLRESREPDTNSETAVPHDKEIADTVVRATLAMNLWIFFWGLLAAAALTLPERFRHPNWLYRGPHY